MGLRFQAEYYQFKIQSSKQKIPSTDIFNSLDDEIFFKDGSVLLFMENKKTDVSIPKCRINLTHKKDSYNRFVCIEFDRMYGDVIEPQMSREVLIDFENQSFFTRVKDDSIEMICIQEVKDYVCNLGLNIDKLEKSYYVEKKKDQDLKNIIIGCINKSKRDNVVCIEQERINRSKKRP